MLFNNWYRLKLVSHWAQLVNQHTNDDFLFLIQCLFILSCDIFNKSSLWYTTSLSNQLICLINDEKWCQKVTKLTVIWHKLWLTTQSMTKLCRYLNFLGQAANEHKPWRKLFLNILANCFLHRLYFTHITAFDSSLWHSSSFENTQDKVFLQRKSETYVVRVKFRALSIKVRFED